MQHLLRRCAGKKFCKQQRRDSCLARPGVHECWSCPCCSGGASAHIAAWWRSPAHI